MHNSILIFDFSKRFFFYFSLHLLLFVKHTSILKCLWNNFFLFFYYYSHSRLQLTLPFSFYELQHKDKLFTLRRLHLRAYRSRFISIRLLPRPKYTCLARNPCGVSSKPPARPMFCVLEQDSVWLVPSFQSTLTNRKMKPTCERLVFHPGWVRLSSF